jgi:preprotein translocase subunit YajC
MKELTLAQAMPGSSFLVSFLPLILIVLIFYLLVFLPQIRKQKRHREMLNSLKKGDKVVTTGGIHGTVFKVKDDIVVCQIAENVKVDLSKSAITTKLGGGGE